MLIKILLGALLLIPQIYASQLSSLQENLNITHINIPNLNLTTDDNSFELLGGIDSLSFYRYTGQQNFTSGILPNSNSNGLTYYSNNTFIQLYEPSLDSRIERIIPFGSDSFILSGKGSLGGYSLSNQLLFNLSSFSLKQIFNQTLDSVNSILVDGTVVCFGGNFTLSTNSLNGHSVALWNYTANSTSLLPFVGFGENSLINSITKLNDDNILFAGKFYTLDNSTLLNVVNDTMRNISDINLGQLIPLSAATWSSTGSFFDEETFVCPDPTIEAWFQNGTSGTLNCNLPFDVAPTKIRIYNSPDPDNEISLFRIFSDPSESIMNLTYIDPVLGQLKHCDAFCPLYTKQVLKSASENVTLSSEMIELLNDNTSDIRWSQDFQEFAFVNQLSASSLRFLALNSYGTNVGLSSFQIYQDAYAIFANNSLNEPSCNSLESFSSSDLSNNTWTRGMDDQNYVKTTYIPHQGVLPEVTFHPDLKYSGQYSIELYTPGCQQDNTCSSRGIVNVTVWNTNNNSILSTTLIYQNNDQLKYDELYSGYLNYSPKITVTYHSGIYSGTTAGTVVVDRLNIMINSLDILNEIHNSTNSLELNGLFQYQLSNFSTSSKDSSIARVANTSINQLTLTGFSSNVSLSASLYNDTLLVGAGDDGLSIYELNKDLAIQSSSQQGIEGKITGLKSYSNGVLVYGDFNSSKESSNVLSFNGSFDSIGNITSPITNFANITIDDSELLVFDNNLIFNVSSSSQISNTSSFSLSLWSSGSNSNGDTLFSGALSQVQFTNLSGSVSIANNLSATSLRSIGSPYAAIFLNDSVTGYVLKNDSSTSEMIFSDGSKAPWRWTGYVDSMLYLTNQSMLAVGSSSSVNGELSILNLDSFKVLANETLNQNSSVKTMVHFERNSSILVGGNFSISNTECFGLCLYNYTGNQWYTFLNGTINGTITKLQIFNDSQLIIAGVFDTKSQSSVNLALMNLTDNKLVLIRWGFKEPVKDFITIDDNIFAWNETSLFEYTSNSWVDIPISNSNSSTTIDSIGWTTTTDNNLKKRDNSETSNNVLIVKGQIYDNVYGHIQAMIYNFEEWIPYLSINSLVSSANQPAELFIDRDVSKLFDSQLALQVSNTTASITASSSTPTPTSSPKKKLHQSKKKIDRGFVVLIGLALALGTMTVLGIVGVILAYAFRDDDGDYDVITPRVNEDEMLKTVPPEKLMEFI
ncbi:hypothetical protein NCAS_0B04980 [Naumovozyma castellii]|uniref:Bud site selection protein RAX2 n=1 Tax=Naumovozyma castellii TaxID=27288 RepID=G0V9G6_NAUCA|nr:hypothetical protein NCAS_0B04980 [Naumovozyma castellii CBS 4309]CCC68582.1 hypothetical protein NCAS_0B04980 [Naumovozyma castellii CBS 4309]